MIHLNFIVEGATEETFVNDVLCPHFNQWIEKLESLKK